MDRVDQVRRILSTRGLTLYRTSQKSAEMFGRSSLFYIPHNLYYDVAISSTTPNIHQLFALSKITNYRLHDWLAVFGFHLEVISRLQTLIPRRRTALLDSSMYDPQAWIQWFVERPLVQSIPGIAPLGQLLTWAKSRRAEELLALNKTKFLYATVGQEDSLTFPDLAPGSIIRINASRATDLLSHSKRNPDPSIFFVEHRLGFACSQLLCLDKDTVALRSPQFPFTQVELTVGKHLRILGVVDAEMRRLSNRDRTPLQSAPIVARELRPMDAMNAQTNLKQLIRQSRVRMGLSFREASTVTRWIAHALADKSYFAAASTLSDYETLSVPPRHIQKIITLCILYSIGFWEFLRVGGLSPDDRGSEPIPDDLIPRQVPDRRRESYIASVEAPPQGERTGFLDGIIEQWQEIPLFLRTSLGELAGLKNLSLSDLYWVGGDRNPIHPWLANATFIAINRRVKKPTESTARTLSEQPLYLLLGRDGNYLCGCCSIQQGMVVVHPYPGNPLSLGQIGNTTDAEVIGRVTAILRRLC
jgi:hypothetical protein